MGSGSDGGSSNAERSSDLDVVQVVVTPEREDHALVERQPLEPVLRFQMKGLGYGHPIWKQGTWHDELAFGAESFDPAGLDLLAPENVHVQQVVRATDGPHTGIGVLEPIVVGPYSSAGFTDFFDVATN